MKVVYTAPNRAHHYRYASALNEAGLLYKFVSGFSRFSPRAAFPEIGDKLVRADKLQTLFLAGLKFKFKKGITDQLAYLAKIEQDKASTKFARQADAFLFYSGCGLNTCKKLKGTNTIKIVEAVNSHVITQEEILSEEYSRLGLNKLDFYAVEKKRRIQEYELADYILMPSDFVKKSFLDLGFSESKLIKVPYGFQSFKESNSEATSGSEDIFTIVYVGSISVRKGLRYLIEAFKKFKHPKKKLVIVGPKAVPSGLEDITIPDFVEFTGVLKGTDLEAVYKSASVFCLPSIEEGLALVLGEALSFGIPIIATENTGATDIITDGTEGFIVPIRNSDSIAHKLQLLADDTDLYAGMRKNAAQKALKLNGWDKTGELLVESLLHLPQK